jgi:hypothetical protein
MKQKLMVKRSFVFTFLAVAALHLVVLPFDTVHAAPPEPTPSAAADIVTALQSYQTTDAGSSQPMGCLLKEATVTPEMEEQPISALDARTFYSIADATVLEGYPSVNLGNTSDMWAGYDVCLNPDGEIARSLIRFDISSLPTNHSIIEATLRVRLVNSCDYEGASRRITTYRITSSWSEGSVTWNNRPSYGSSYGSRSIVHGDWGWYEFDVTNLVKSWYGGTYANHGIMLRGPEVLGWRGFSTRESSYRPQLVVEYDNSTPPTISGLPDLTLDANTSLDNAIDLWTYTSDAESPDSDLTFSIDNTPNPNAGVSVDSDRYIDVNPTSGWTGQTNVTIRVMDPAGTSDTDSFQVTVLPSGPPVITSITPYICNNNEVAHITDLAGSNLHSGATVRLIKAGQSDILAANVAVVSASKITCDLDLRGACPGHWTVRVTNPDAQYDELPDGLTVKGFVYLPVVARSIDPPSSPPVLDAISNPDGDGNYTVRWSTVSRATNYTLEEDDNANLSSPTTVYAGPDTSKPITGKDVGTYYYRVKASNASGSSDWSNVRSVTVSAVAPGPEPGHYTGTPSVSFDVTENQQVCDFDIRVPFGIGSCRIRPGCTDITDSDFVFSQAEMGAIYTITGTFDSRTHAVGRYSVAMCGGSISIPPSRGSWEASK